MISGIGLLQPPASSKFIRPWQNYVKFEVKSLAHRCEQKANIASKKYVFQLSLGVVFMSNSVEFELHCFLQIGGIRRTPRIIAILKLLNPVLQLGNKRCRLLGSHRRMQNSQFSRFASQPSRRAFQETAWKAACTLNRRRLLGSLSRGHTPPVLFDCGTAELAVENRCFLSLFPTVL